MQLAINSQNIWDIISVNIKKQIGTATYNSWIKPLQFISEANEILVLSAPTKFIKDWVENNYKHKFKQIAAGKLKDIRIEVNAIKIEKSEVVELVNYKDSVGSRIDPRFTFDSFITATSNELAAAAAKRVAELAENAGFNPLFIHGGVGIGKTHLLHAIANYASKPSKGKQVVYLSAEKFMYQFMRALRERTIVDFKDHLRNVDVLMVDDFQFILGKEASQEELFQTFNAVIDAGKQLVISCDRIPLAFENMPERMKSRLASGLVIDIAAADYDLRLKILRSKVASIGINVPEEIILFLAEKITSNIRELEGSLNRIIARASLINSEITLQNARSWVADLLQITPRQISVEQIQAVVAEKYGLKTSDLLSGSKSIAVARPRQIAMYIAKKLTTKSLPELGKLFGGKDHATVIHSCKKIEELIMSDSKLSIAIDALILRIRN